MPCVEVVAGGAAGENGRGCGNCVRLYSAVGCTASRNGSSWLRRQRASPTWAPRPMTTAPTHQHRHEPRVHAHHTGLIFIPGTRPERW